ncbi:MAG: dephospho-CoA kinase [Bryobacterales bacterium]|nr:dephospho-CoA kinase [Bryobacterales bacterium]
MLRVGLTGGLASGKSFIAHVLEDAGCHVIRADELGHEVLQPGAEAYAAAVAEFGQGILNEDGSIDRRRLAALVFDHPDRLAVLNNIVHPAVFRRQDELIRAAEEQDPSGIVIVEAAIMYETGSHTRYQKMIVAVCSEEQQIQRAMKRDDADRESVMARLRRQLPLAEKASRADFVIDTSGTKEETTRQTLEVYRQLRSLAG